MQTNGWKKTLQTVSIKRLIGVTILTSAKNRHQEYYQY